MNVNKRLVEPLKALIINFTDILNDKLSQEKIIGVLNKLINNEKLNKDDLDVYNENKFIDKADLSDEYYDTLNFIVTYLNPNGLPLEEFQLEIVNKIIDRIDNSIPKDYLTKMININNDVLKKLEDGVHLDASTMENIEYILVNELDYLKIALKENNQEISSSTITNILTNLLKYNAANAQFIEDEEVEEDIEEDIEEEPTVDTISEDVIKSILDKYGYVGVFDSLEEEAKKYILKHAEEKRVIELLEELNKYRVVLRTGSDYGRIDKKNKLKADFIFAKIIGITTKENINELYDSFKSYKDASFIDFVEKQQRVLIPEDHLGARKRRRKSKNTSDDNTDAMDNQQGCMHNFILNTMYFKKLGFNLDYILNKSDNVLVANYKNVEAVYDILSNVYGITFNENNPVGVSALANTPSLIQKVLDWFIESTQSGYKYIKNNPTIVCDPVKPLYQIKLAGDSIFHDLGKRGFVRYSKPTTAPTDRIYDIITMSKEELASNFDHDDKGSPVTRCIIPTEIAKLLDGVISVSDDKATYSWTSDPRLLNNEYIQYLENNCRVSTENSAYDYLYVYNDTLISRKKVFRIIGLLMDAGLFNNNDIKDNVKYAISYNSILNDKNVSDINELVGKMFGSFSRK